MSSLLKALWSLWKEHWNTDPLPTDFLFGTPGSKRAISNRKTMHELLVAGGLDKGAKGASRTSYSLRHFHISQQLRQNVDVFKLALNTGTSPEMIRRFYADNQLEEMRGDFAKPWRPAGYKGDERGV